MADTDSAAQLDGPSDFGDDEAATARRWISELELSEKDQAKWLERGRKIIKKYKEESDLDVKRRRFSLLWANVQTLAPAVYARTPTAVVSRRFKDADPVGRVASEVLERALNFQIDACDFADIMTGLRDEFLLVARGCGWVRYVPHMASMRPEASPDAEGEPTDAPDGEVTEDAASFEVVEWEETVPDHVQWEDFGTNPARNWSEVRFVWRRTFLTRDELKKRFTKPGASGKTVGELCPLDWGEKSGDDAKDTQFAKAAVFEIWDKPSKKVIWICKGYPEAVLDERADPLKLKDFFPCPRPILGTCGPDSTIPVPDYVYYESQAHEVDELTVRIGLLTDALKVTGLYSSSEKKNLDELFTSKTNTLIPVDSWAALQDKGGIKGIIEWLPIDMVVSALKTCIETRKQILDDVFQLTGIADIMRGDSDPDETAAAQKIKATWGSSRVRDRQKEMSRFARDMLRIMGEVIAGQFSQETLAEMTGVKLLTNAEKQQVQAAQQALQQQTQLAVQAQQAHAQQAQIAQQQGAPPPPAPAPPQPPPPMSPELVQMMGLPSWEDVMALLQNNALRHFRIDIETDSTIEPDDQEEKQRRVEFVGAVGKFLAESLPVVQAAPQMLPVIVEGLKFLVRGFRVGREMEDTIDRALDALQQAAAQPKPPQPADPADQLKAQAAQVTAQARMMDARTNAQAAMARTQMEGQAHMVQTQAENARTQADAQMAAHQQRLNVAQHALAVQDQAHGQAMDAHQLALQTVQEASQRELRREVLDHSPAKVGTP